MTKFTVVGIVRVNRVVEFTVVDIFIRDNRVTQFTVVCVIVHISR